MMVSRGKLTNGGVATTGLLSATVDDTGLTVATETKECDRSLLFSVLPKIDSTHPLLQRLVLKNLSWEFLPNFRAQFTMTYKGIPEETLPNPVYSASSTTGQQDISTFPGFISIAGTQDAPMNGAVFDPETGLFVGFGTDAPDSLRGVSSYFAPSVVVTKTSYFDSEPEAGQKVGKIDDPGFSLAQKQLDPMTDQDYLKITADIEGFGVVWRLSEAWLRSGDNGWAFELYN